MSKQSISLCIPSTVISPRICRSQQQATHTVHQIARAAVTYGVSEIIVYDVAEEKEEAAEEETGKPKKLVFTDDAPVKSGPQAKAPGAPSAEALRIASLLQFFVTPSYLRKTIFGDLKALQYAKKLPKIPHLPFLSHASTATYIEGISVHSALVDADGARIAKKQKGSRKSKKQLELEASTTYVQVGDNECIKLDDMRVPTGMRVTVDIKKRKVVSPKDAYKSELEKSAFISEAFGYSVRVAPTFGKVFTECGRADGYSYTMYVPSEAFAGDSGEYLEIPKSNSAAAVSGGPNLLFVYGRWKDVDAAVRNDNADLKDLTDASSLFDGRLDLRNGGRTEDAVLASLARLA